jgi:hypothetical protein
MRLIFSPTPSPVLGKFSGADAAFLADKYCMYAWDHEWVSYLVANNRLLVQTHLEDGMSIEPEQVSEAEERPTAELMDNVAMAAKLSVLDETELRRQRKFYCPHLFCFTTNA